jgi:hypothetical protein
MVRKEYINHERIAATVFLSVCEFHDRCCYQPRSLALLLTIRRTSLKGQLCFQRSGTIHTQWCDMGLSHYTFARAKNVYATSFPPLGSCHCRTGVLRLRFPNGGSISQRGFNVRGAQIQIYVWPVPWGKIVLLSGLCDQLSSSLAKIDVRLHVQLPGPPTPVPVCTQIDVFAGRSQVARNSNNRTVHHHLLH